MNTGCLSDTTEMQLKRKPRFDFYVDNEEGCQPYSLEIFGQPVDDFLYFNWLANNEESQQRFFRNFQFSGFRCF